MTSVEKLRDVLIDITNNGDHKSMATNLLTVTYLVRRLLVVNPDEVLNTLDNVITNNVDSFSGIRIGMAQAYWRGSLYEYHFMHTLIGVARELGNKTTRQNSMLKVSPESLRRFNVPGIEKVITHYSA